MASCRTCATLREATCRSSKEAKSPTNQTYSTGSLRVEDLELRAPWPSEPAGAPTCRRSSLGCRSSGPVLEQQIEARPRRQVAAHVDDRRHVFDPHRARLDAGHAGRARPREASPEISGSRPSPFSLLLRIFVQAIANVEDHLPRRQRRPLAVAGRTAVQRPHSVQVSRSSTCFQVRSKARRPRPLPQPGVPARRPARRARG